MADIKRISPQEAKELCEQGYIYVDVRSEAEFAEGHPEGSINVPVFSMTPQGMVPNTDFLTVMESAFPKDTKLVLGCRSGGRSLRAASMLIEAGYSTVLDQRAGFEGARDAFGSFSEKGWALLGLPVTCDDVPGKAYSDLLLPIKLRDKPIFVLRGYFAEVTNGYTHVEGFRNNESLCCAARSTAGVGGFWSEGVTGIPPPTLG